MAGKVIEGKIAISSTGIVRLPVKIRRLLGLSEKGAKLKMMFTPYFRHS